MLASLILIPLAVALAIVVLPAASARAAALLGTLAAAAMTVVALIQFQWDPRLIPNQDLFQFTSSYEWLKPLGINLSFGADSISMLMIALAALLGPICVLASWTAITERVKTYYAWLLVLQAAMVGVFVARDLIFFYICFEFTLIPMYVLISLYGSTNRKRAATTFFLYTFTGSVITLAGLAYVAYFNSTLPFDPKTGFGTWTFDIDTLKEAAADHMNLAQQSMVLLALLCGFAVKVPLFPVHTWLPLAHTEAPTAGSVILAGVLLKLGTYGIYRFALGYTPDAFIYYAPLIATLCIVGILYGGLICWVQSDVKKLVAYSSVAHLGFCVLGLAALNHTGIQGSILYMINHGLSTGALFLLIGFMYERYHTRNMKEIGGLAAKMPIWATFMVFFVMASVGLPGLNGFVSEFLCMFGTFQASDQWSTGVWGSEKASTIGATIGKLGPWYAAVASLGVIVAAMYLLIMVGKVVFGPLKEPGGHDGHGHAGAHSGGHAGAHAADSHSHLPADLTAREITALVPLALACLIFGVYPKPLFEALKEPVQQTVMWVHKIAPPPMPEGNVNPNMIGSAEGKSPAPNEMANAASNAQEIAR